MSLNECADEFRQTIQVYELDLHFSSSKNTLETLMSMRCQDVFMLEAAPGVAQLYHQCGVGAQHSAEEKRGVHWHDLCSAIPDGLPWPPQLARTHCG